MYLQYFGLTEAPFSITPDPAFVYLSAAHRDALAHLMYGVGQGGSGGFVQLTGEVGTGKTTLCRCLLEQVPDDCRVALVLNPLMTPGELLATICEELGVDVSGMGGSNKGMVDALNAFLLRQHAEGNRVVVVIDEAQNLSPEALEQVRLLTNLETSKDKLLQMVLLGQPELRQLLQRQNLRQLAQRITARYHLSPLSYDETSAYVRHRIKVAGAARNPFRKSALRALYQRSGGVPRLINIIADRALTAAYAAEAGQVSARMVNAAADEVQPSEQRVRSNRWPLAVAAGIALLAVALAAYVLMPGLHQFQEPLPERVDASDSAPVTPVPRDLPVPEQAIPVAAAESPEPAGPDLQPEAAAEDGASLPIGGYASAVEDAAPPTDDLDPQWLQSRHIGAWRELAGLWGETGAAASIQAACDGAARTGFACVRDQGNWSRIRQLGLPVLLVLRGGNSRLLLLRGLGDDTVLVGSGADARTVPRDLLDSQWLGEYVVAWPQAPDWPHEIRRGESGAAVDIVMEMAAFAVPAWLGEGVFDAEFEGWLTAFQRRNGLKPDGIIGPNTLIHLMAPTIDQPRLLLEREETS